MMGQLSFDLSERSRAGTLIVSKHMGTPHWALLLLFFFFYVRSRRPRQRDTLVLIVDEAMIFFWTNRLIERAAELITGRYSSR